MSQKTQVMSDSAFHPFQFECEHFYRQTQRVNCADRHVTRDTIFFSVVLFSIQIFRIQRITVCERARVPHLIL